MKAMCKYCLSCVLLVLLMDFVLFSLFVNQLFPELTYGDSGYCANILGREAFGCYTFKTGIGYINLPMFSLAFHEHLHHLGVHDENTAVIGSLLVVAGEAFIIGKALERWCS